MGKLQFKKRGKPSKLCENDAKEESLAACEGYKIVKLKTFKDSEIVHFVLGKEHSVREKCDRKPENRTLFLRGVPPFVSEESLKFAFSSFGNVTDVFFHSAPSASIPQMNSSIFFEDVPPLKGFKVAYLVFENEDEARKAVLAPSEVPLVLFPGEANSPNSTSTLEKWIDEYNVRASLDLMALKKEIDNYMANYDSALHDAEMSEKEKEEDDDGWITVTKKSGIPRKESVHNKIMKKQNNRVQKSQLVNFYRFQIRESKMNQLVKLREKFEEDKKRIAQLKESRKFKPF